MPYHDAHKLQAGWFDLLFIGGLVAIILFRVNEPMFLFGVLSALFLLWKWKKNPVPFTWVDKSIIVILIYQILNIFFSVEPLSGFFAIKTLVFSIIFYFLLRTGINRSPKIETFLFVFCFLIALLCCVALITFLLFRATCVYVEFTELYDFRYLYKPLGYLSNVWGTLLVGFTGIVLLALHLDNQKKTHFYFYLVLFSLLLWNIVVSFSRGVYISTAVLLVLYLVFLISSSISKMQKRGILIALLFPLLISGFINKQDVIKTLQFNKTLSQQRSIENRVENMSFSYELLKENPLTGTGAGTYSLVINEYRYEDDNNSFTNFAPNGYTQLLIEQGVLGFIFWGLLFVIVFITIFKKRKDSQVAIITGIIFVAVLMREATFPVLLESGGFQLLIFTVLAISQNMLSCKETHKTSKYIRYFPVTTLGIAILICTYSIHCTIDEDNNQKALYAMNTGKLEEAEKYISKTSERTPYLINRSLICKELYKNTQDTSFLNKAENYLRKAALKNPYDMMINFYQAFILREKGEKKQALAILTELTQKFSNKSLYRLAVFDILYQDGEPERAIPHLAQAVELSPDLLSSSYLQDILMKDKLLSESLKNDLLHTALIEKTVSDPVLLAKSAKILLSFGFEKEAKSYLEKAIKQLPNLIYPYYYLCMIETKQHNSEQSMIYLKKFVFLYSSILSKDIIDKTVNSGEIAKLLSNRRYFTDNSYMAKFQTWYRSST
ncbi:MAG: O-antigen ligase family protein, partial [Dysgonamonadaceae bacterium]|nr:O-antigen ligase family protein [Dysgonamonadaceae bacterium]